jgi:chromosome segregation protein
LPVPDGRQWLQMKIKRVEIIGFKSFVDRVSFDFQQGVTSVVGPNGCGKSNIVDAIRWSMGEQNAKNLRGRSMEDVIFGGSESRKPLGMAEVSMFFDNSDGRGPAAFRDYAEIMVTRRLYRNGESEYLINKTPCRLLDISELYMDTGVGARAYSIIEQGKIGMILNAKPEDRRYLIEEAAGVTKYKSRKKSALRKIEASRQNLLRLGDIVAEVRRQMNSLKRQAQKAERFRSLREELKGIETRIAAERYRKMQTERDDVCREELGRQQELEGASGQLAEQELHLEEMRLQHVDREKAVIQGQERLFHLAAELQKTEGRLELSQREIETLLRQQERLAAEQEENARRRVGLDEEEASLQAGSSSLGSELEGMQRQLGEGEAHLEECAANEQDLVGRLETTRTALYELLNALSRAGSQHDEARRRLQALEERAARNRKDAVTVREQAEEAQALLAALEVTLQGFRERRTGLQQQRGGLQETVLTLRRRIEENENALLVRREELNRFRSRLETLRQLEKNLEGYGAGVKTLLGENAFRGRFGPMVADFLEVPARYEAAVEAALGDRLQALPATAGDALEALAFLRQKDGRCTFVLPGLSPFSPAAINGATPLLELVQPRPGAESTVAVLLAGMCLVESLEPFLAMVLAAGVVLVTEAGETLSARGELTGGGRQALAQGLLHKRREMKELAERVGGLEAVVEGLQAERQQLREDLTEAEEQLRETEAALHRKELKVVDSEKDLLRTSGEAERLRERLEVLSLEEDQLHEERVELECQLREASRGREEQESRKTLYENEVARLQEELQVLRRETETVRERVTSLKVAVASLREREEGSRRSLERLAQLRVELRARASLLTSREAEGKEEEERLRSEMERQRVELDLLFGRREEEKGRFEKVRERFEAGSREIEAQEEMLKGLRNRLHQARESLSTLQLKGRELEMQAEHLRQSVLERYRLDLAEASAPTEAPCSAADGERRIQELRRLIDDIGEVNLTAIEEFQELEGRFNFLSVQQEDLRQSLEGLQTAITKINRTTRKRFRETFDQINAKFQEVFPRLFRGGRAELQLTDEEDLLETGIDIVVQPPGKKLQNVNLLSGGEKALTAVALIFSIFLIKPSPFCILDEVDAPLDDVNIGRFNELVKEMSEISQFIIITHNKRTMQIADTLYGVTMEEPGVSKLVSVRINEF